MIEMRENNYKIKISRVFPFIGLIIILTSLFYDFGVIFGISGRMFETTNYGKIIAYSGLFFTIFYGKYVILWPLEVTIFGWVLKKIGDKISLVTNNDGLKTFYLSDLSGIKFMHHDKATIIGDIENYSSFVEFTLKNGKKYAINMFMPKDNPSDIYNFIMDLKSSPR